MTVQELLRDTWPDEQRALKFSEKALVLAYSNFLASVHRGFRRKIEKPDFRVAMDVLESRGPWVSLSPRV